MHIGADWHQHDRAGISDASSCDAVEAGRSHKRRAESGIASGLGCGATNARL